MFKYLCKVLFVSILLVTYSALADIVVIVHPSNASTLDKKSLSSIFLGKSKTFPSGTKAVPVNLSSAPETRSNFNKTVLGKSDSQVKAIWSRLVFSGRAKPPKEMSTDEVIAEISKNPNAIGYIEKDKASENVKVIDLSAL